MSEGVKKSCFVFEGVRKIPVFVQGVKKIPILSKGVTENILPPSYFFNGIALSINLDSISIIYAAVILLLGLCSVVQFMQGRDTLQM